MGARQSSEGLSPPPGPELGCCGLRYGRGSYVRDRSNGVRLHYEVMGEGPPLVFVHGMCGRGAVWAGQVQRLADEFTCVSYDRRGHGSSSDAEAPHSVPLHGDDFAALVKGLGLPPVVLVGSSGGARVG